MQLNKLPFFRELRQARNAWLTYHRLWDYLRYRFVVGPKLARAGKPLDRAVDTDRYSIHILCSHGDLLELQWALASWYTFAEDSAQVTIRDDGSLSESEWETLRKLFPHAQLIPYADATKEAEARLGAYPAARRFRTGPGSSAYAVKLMDSILSGDSKGILVMDPDILWFETPYQLHEAMRDYQAAVFWPGSGKPSRQPFRDGSELRLDLAALNSGVVYFERAAFKIEVLEEYCAKLPDGEKLLDQPGFAYVLGERGEVRTLPVENYHIHGAATGETIGKHYTGPRREQFWFEGVQRLKRSAKLPRRRASASPGPSSSK